MRRAGLTTVVVLGFCMTWATAWAQDTLIFFDGSLGEVSGARYRSGQLPIAPQDGDGYWRPPKVALATTIAAGGGMLGAGLGDAVAQQIRNNSLAPLREPVMADDRLQRHIHGHIEQALAQRGRTAARSLSGRGLTSTVVEHAAADPGTTGAVFLDRDRNLPIVSLSWNDRYLLLATRIHAYQRRQTGFRRLHSLSVRYVSLPAPADEPLAHWSAQDSQLFFSELDRGIPAMLELGLDGPPKDLPKARRRDTVTFDIQGVATTFRGRLWKQDGDFAYLVTSDRGVTVVNTGPGGSGSRPPAP